MECKASTLFLQSYGAGDILFSDYAGSTPTAIEALEDYSGGLMTHSFTTWDKTGAAPFFQFSEPTFRFTML